MMVDILNQRRTKQGFIIAADNAGAGIGDKVLISQGAMLLEFLLKIQKYLLTQ